MHFTRDLLPISPLYPWVHIVCLTRRGPTGEVLQAACWPALLLFALDVKTTADGQSYIRIDAE